MIRTLPAFALLLLAAPAAAEERRFSVTDYDRVQVDGPFEVTLSTGLANAAIASGTAAEIERVAIDVQGRTLRIRSNISAWGGYPGEGARPAHIALATHDLRGVNVRGAGKLSIDKIKAMRFDMILAGSGSIDAGQVETDVLVLSLFGSGVVRMAGSTKTLRASVEGSGNLEAEALAADDAELSSGSAGRIALNVRRAATVTATGSGTTTIAGNPACTVKQLGSGPVFCGTESDQR